MKIRIGLVTKILVTSALFLNLYGDDIEEMKIEIQKLKEKVTELNNKVALKRNDEYGKGFSVGIPAGLYNQDWVAGLDIGYTFKKNFEIRLDLQFLGHNAADSLLFIAIPTIGFITKSNCISNFQIYGGFFLGITQEINQLKGGPYFQLKGLGGVEFFVSRMQSFFVEAGGGGVITDHDISYTRGVVLTAGSRFHF